MGFQVFQLRGSGLMNHASESGEGSGNFRFGFRVEALCEAESPSVNLRLRC